MNLQATQSGVRSPSIEFFSPAWFVPSMGWSGLALAWSRAEPLFAESAHSISLVAASIAAFVFVVVFFTSCYRALRFFPAVQSDARHPIRHCFFASVPISIILLTGLAQQLTAIDSAILKWFWLAGCGLEWLATLWVLSRWLGPAVQGGLKWPAITPVLFIPVAGNVLVPMSGIDLGYEGWTAAQCMMGVMLYPVLLTLIMVRLGQAGPLPSRLAPTWFIMMAPPSALALSIGGWSPPDLLIWSLWGIALTALMLALTQLKIIKNISFGMPHWGLSFPFAAFTALSLKLSQTAQGYWLAWPSMLLLVCMSSVILWLTAMTLKGLLQGDLLQPEQ